MSPWHSIQSRSLYKIFCSNEFVASEKWWIRVTWSTFGPIVSKVESAGSDSLAILILLTPSKISEVGFQLLQTNDKIMDLMQFYIFTRWQSHPALVFHLQLGLAKIISWLSYLIFVIYFQALTTYISNWTNNYGKNGKAFRALNISLSVKFYTECSITHWVVTV